MTYRNEREILERLAKLEDNRLTGHVSWALWFSGWAIYCVATRDSPWFLASLLVGFAFHVASVRPQWRRYRAARVLLGKDDED